MDKEMTEFPISKNEAILYEITDIQIKITEDETLLGTGQLLITTQ
jgi:hypothetical protein